MYVFASLAYQMQGAVSPKTQPMQQRWQMEPSHIFGFITALHFPAEWRPVSARDRKWELLFAHRKDSSIKHE